MDILFISLISKDDKPLYIQSFDESQEDGPISAAQANKFLKYNFLSHMALDVFASPASLDLRESQNGHDGVLLLFIQDEVTVYGMETNNGLKIVAGTSQQALQMTDIKTLFTKVHKCYLRTVCNPFTDLQGQHDYENLLQSSSFDKRIKEIVESFKLAEPS